MLYLLPLFWLSLVGADFLRHDVFAQRTTSITTTITPNLAPSPTEKPRIIERRIRKRADSIPVNICGWFSGLGYASSLDNVWSYENPSITCFWNSDAKNVGDHQPLTACLDYTQLSTWTCASAGCSSSVVQCSSTAPYCVTMSYGTDYQDFICSETPGATLYIESTYLGMTDPIAFPIYTGSRGISTGLQYPPGYSIPVTTTSDTTSTASTSSSIPISTTSVGSSVQTTSSSSSSPSSSDSTLSSGAKAGIGIGAAVVSVLLIAILLYHLRRRGAHNIENNTIIPHSLESSEKPELPTMPEFVQSVPPVPAMAELSTNRNTSSRRPNNPPQQTETYSGLQFAVEIDDTRRESQLPELESTRVPNETPAASSIATNAILVSRPNEGATIEKLPCDAAQSPDEVHDELKISMMVERALEMEYRGEYPAAEEIHRQVVQWRNKVQGPEHLDTLSSMYRLVLVLEMQQKYQECQELYWQLLSLRERALGLDPPSPSLGEGLMLQHKYEAAENMDRHELNLNSRVLGPEHRYTLISTGDLANVLRLQGKFAEAEEEYRQTLELSDKVFGRLHPYTLQVINNFGVTLDIQGKKDEAKEIYRQSLERNVEKRGHDHPDTYSSFHNLRAVLDENETISIDGKGAEAHEGTNSTPVKATVRIHRK